MIAGWWRLVSNPVEPFPGEKWSWGTMPWLLAVCWAPCLLPQHLQAAQLSLQELVFLPALCCWSWSFWCCCLPQTNVCIFLNKMWNSAVLPVFRGDRWLVHFYWHQLRDNLLALSLFFDIFSLDSGSSASFGCPQHYLTGFLCSKISRKGLETTCC